MKIFEARIYVPDNKTERWYVYIYNLQTQKICKKFYKGINTTDDRAERMMRCEQFKLAIEAEIRGGWQPDGVKTVKTEIMPFADALEFALSKKSVSKKTHADYSCTLRFVRKAIKSLRLSQLHIHNCERIHVKTVMDYLEKKHKWKGKNYNKHLSCLSSLFTELVEWELIKTNPVRDIRARYEEKTEGYIQPTDKQHKKIFSRLKEIDYHYYIFCSIEYYLGIRPKEILSLKCADVDMQNGIIRVMSADAKNKSYRYVPILAQVKKLLSGFDLSKSDNFLFGRPKPYGCRFFKHEYFCPNPYPIKRDTSTRKWKEYVIDGLGIDVKCYSLKHKGANDKLKAGMDLKTISEMFGHSNEKITEIYANHINRIRFEQAQSIQLENF